MVAQIYHIYYFEVVFHGRSSSFEVFKHFALVTLVYIPNLDKIGPVVANKQSICTGWLRRICGGGCAGYVVVVAQDMWWVGGWSSQIL